MTYGRYERVRIEGLVVNQSVLVVWRLRDRAVRTAYPDVADLETGAAHDGLFKRLNDRGLRSPDEGVAPDAARGVAERWSATHSAGAAWI